MERKILVTILLGVSMTLKGCGTPPSASAPVSTASSVINHAHTASKSIENDFSIISSNIHYLVNPESRRKNIAKRLQKMIYKTKSQNLALAF